ncbi:MAG: PilZ domain-containing protein [bacterium]|nr:PilZ domain-containing protein [bacterium]
MEEDRRQSERVRCRIRCTVHVGDEQLTGCLLDVSEGGLCLLSPEAVQQHDSLRIHIDVPGLGRVTVSALAWHVRRVQGARSGKRAWAVGAALVKADPGYTSLLREEGILLEASEGNQDAAVGGVNAGDLTVFKVRVKKKNGPRSRLLSLTARDEAEARRLTLNDLDDSWSIVDVAAA